MTEPEYLHPNWSNLGRVHDWKSHVTHEILNEWENFTDIQKAMLFRCFESMANNEEWD